MAKVIKKAKPVEEAIEEVVEPVQALVEQEPEGVDEIPAEAIQITEEELEEFKEIFSYPLYEVKADKGTYKELDASEVEQFVSALVLHAGKITITRIN